MKNKGYSLLEAIVTIAILGVLTGLLVTSSGLFDGRRVKACSDNIASVLEKVRMATLGKDEVILTIYRDPVDGIKGRIVTKVKNKNDSYEYIRTFEDELGKDNVEVYYSADISGSSPSELSTAGMAGIVFRFNRSSGALEDVSGFSTVRSIIVKKGHSERKIKIYKETGKIEIE